MKTRALAVLLPLLALAGCTADNNVSVQVYQLCAPPDGSCTFQAECEAQYIGVNVLDLGLSDTFWSFVEVHNQMPINTAEDVGRGNTHDAYVEEFQVDYDVVGGPALPSVTRRVEAGPSIVPAEGTSVISVLPIPPEVGAQITTATQVVANVRLRGFLADQSTFETAAFPIPVQICTNCVNLPGCTDPAQTLYVCPQAGQSPASSWCE